MIIIIKQDMRCQLKQNCPKGNHIDSCFAKRKVFGCFLKTGLNAEIYNLDCTFRYVVQNVSDAVLKVWMDGHGRRPGTYFEYVLGVQPLFM